MTDADDPPLLLYGYDRFMALRRTNPEPTAPILPAKKSSLKSKGGEQVELAFYEDAERDNRGWRVDRIDAIVDGEPAGHLKISYIPSEEWEKRYPTPLHYAASGMTGGYHEVERVLGEEPDMAKWDRQQLLDAIESASGWMPSSELDRIGQMSDEDLRAEWKVRKDRVVQKHQVAFDDAKEYHVDRPLVDFIRVYEAGICRRYVDGEQKALKPIGKRPDGEPIFSKDMQRRGIATVLCEAGVLWLAERSMVLHGSGVLTDDGRALTDQIEIMPLDLSMGL